MKSSKSILMKIVFILFLMIAFCQNGITTVSAPPILSVQRTGFFLSNETNATIDNGALTVGLSVLTADEGNFSYSVNMNYSFHIRNTMAKNHSIVLAYATVGGYSDFVSPFKWYVEPSGENYTASQHECTNLTVHNWADEAGIYHLINVTMRPFSTSDIDIDIHYDFWVVADYFDFSTGVGQNLPWKSSAMQSVVISIMNRTLFEGIDFQTNENLAISTFEESKNGTWNLNMTRYHEDFLITRLKQNTYLPPRSPVCTPVVAVAVVLITLAVGFFALCQERKAKSMVRLGTKTNLHHIG
ncbi:MAG: hypothetical protein GF309_01300 [Candidatus Lokiarchaeota archaeon]|nr:hypothetical protein [Candidatus Lokiarchaeota archaeon]